ncbi:hypothetical protein ESY86_03630 [Subsaximicrobium wynnwilliamsii]|uniref:Lipocalin family protein n=1 Tax=Subsaximicrobium wynnwilliamsii TaxID=291179 RepID=A0A5C6ZJI9_9FLAO|nr:hypothetical protein [Subsaximicrobium wynnwilliamsii]TXD84797.1 hypothetical protein ESY87_03410 [Subsaximicrobium wynnwilliamsii]TXD90468.1 hypothetical protein ESY86_03630 [Subsaximicrobium wynnwilliamsii]TXE04944.1 hypothetical protein ESY88_01940 [Subsaximicrobium wynnwilliamsii]
MKTHKKRIIGVFILFLMVSCALESQFALPNDEKINPEFIGEWYSEENDDESIKITKNGEKSYRLQVFDENETNESIAFSKTIKGFSIMNIQTETKGIITYVFYGFNVEGNTLTFSEVNDKLRHEEFESESELLRFFEENLTKEDFFINPTELKRK